MLALLTAVVKQFLEFQASESSVDSVESIIPEVIFHECFRLGPYWSFARSADPVRLI
jgi:hypothetical protein